MVQLSANTFCVGIKGIEKYKMRAFYLVKDPTGKEKEKNNFVLDKVVSFSCYIVFQVWS